MGSLSVEVRTEVLCGYICDLEGLVRDMWSYINAPVNQRNSLKERLAIYDDLADRMRELMAEVDE